MQFADIFSRLGFGSHAHEIYQTLFESGEPLLVAHIARSVGVARAEVYRNIEQLLDMQFVRRVTVGRRTFYTAESPRRIEQEFRRVVRSVSTTTTRAAEKTERELPEHVKYFKGFSGIRAVFDDTISHTPRGETFYRYTSERDLEAVNRYLSRDYRAKRDKKKLERLVISNPVSGSQKRPRLERFIKYIPPDTNLFDQNIIQLVYGNRLAFINLNSEEAYVIEDKLLADFQKVIFNQLYRLLP